MGLRVLDIRHTLPNLKYLLYVLTAGTGDMPARKAGGVRGLVGGRTSSEASRRTSEDSVQSLPPTFRPDKNQTRANGGGLDTTEKDVGDPFVSKSPAHSMPYRQGSTDTSGR